MAGGHDPRDPVHVHPDVAPAGEYRLAGVQPDAHPHLPFAGPGVLGQAPLHGGRCLHRVDGRPEDAEERVALGRHLDTVMAVELGTDDGAVLGEEVGVLLGQACEEPVEPSMSVMQKVTVPVGSVPVGIVPVGRATRRRYNRTSALSPVSVAGGFPGAAFSDDTRPRTVGACPAGKDVAR